MEFKPAYQEVAEPGLRPRIGDSNGEPCADRHQSLPLSAAQPLITAPICLGLDPSTVQSPDGLLASPQCLMPGSLPQPAQASGFLFMMSFRLVASINTLNSDSDLDFPFAIFHTGCSLCLHDKKCVCFNSPILGNQRLSPCFLVHRDVSVTRLSKLSHSISCCLPETWALLHILETAEYVHC